MKTTAKEIVNWVGMSEFPAVYANRAATWSDLSGSNLFWIHDKIKREIDENAAEAFVAMVENLNILSAFNFLNALFALEERGWVYAPFEGIDLGVGPGDTEYIRNTFLARIHKIPSLIGAPEQLTYLSF